MAEGSRGVLAAGAGALANWWADALLRSYSQVLFSPSRAVGMVLLAATFVEPMVGLAGLATTLVGLLAGRLFRLQAAALASGVLTFNSVLVGLGVGAMVQPTPWLFLLVPVAGVVSVGLTAVLSSLLSSKWNLPSLTLPFIFSVWILHAVAGLFSGMALYPVPWEPVASQALVPQAFASFLESLGALFFIPRQEVGILVAVALLLFSRIGFALSLLGFAVAYGVSFLAGVTPTAPLFQNIGFNLMLVALALGSVWFVPTWATCLLALAASVFAGAVALVLSVWAPLLGLSPLTMPFVMTVLLVLVARR